MPYLNFESMPDMKVSNDVMIQKFTHSQVKKMTKNFTTSLLGKGGYDEVFHGKNDKGEEVVVKKLIRSKLSPEGIKGFQTVVNILENINHGNIVKLIGYCDDAIEHLALVYEYMEGGSLKDHLSDEGKRSQLSCRKRLQIACEVAEGLKYLHKGWDPPIIHGNIRPHNILLTKDLKAKIGGFDVTKMFEDFENDSVNATPSHVLLTKKFAFLKKITKKFGIGDFGLSKKFENAGTRGYLDPEYETTHELRDKSDVYSFGVVLMVLITGLSAFVTIVDRKIHITEWVRERVSRSEIEEIIDTSIKEEYDENSVLDFLKIAEKCTGKQPQHRPDITEVVEEIKKLCTAYDEPSINE